MIVPKSTLDQQQHVLSSTDQAVIRPIKPIYELYTSLKNHHYILCRQYNVDIIMFWQHLLPDPGDIWIKITHFYQYSKNHHYILYPDWYKNQ